MLAIYGIELLGEDREMARLHDILVWEQENVDCLYEEISKNVEIGKNKLLDQLGVAEYSNPEIDHLNQRMNY